MSPALLLFICSKEEKPVYPDALNSINVIKIKGSGCPAWAFSWYREPHERESSNRGPWPYLPTKAGFCSMVADM